jgi:hypothetical protein
MLFTGPGIRTISMMAQFLNCMRIISLCFENNSKQICKAGIHKTRVNLFCTLETNIRGFQVWNVLHFDILRGRGF